MSGERMGEIAGRAAFDVLPVDERHAILRAEIAAMSNDEWIDETVPKPLEVRARQCREDRAFLLARVEELGAALRGMLHDDRYAYTALLLDGGHIFRCFYCERGHGTISEIAHGEGCPVPAARAVVPEVEP